MESPKGPSLAKAGRARKQLTGPKRKLGTQRAG